MSRRLLNFEGMRRIPAKGWVAGVCAGVAEYFDWNVRVLRLVLVVTFLASGFFPIVVVYCVLWYVLEEGAPGSSFDPREAPSPAPAGGAAVAYTVPTRPPSLKDVHARFARLDERLRNIEECVTDKEFELRRELKKLEA
jgi:phage shock protein C